MLTVNDAQLIKILPRHPNWCAFSANLEGNWSNAQATSFSCISSVYVSVRTLYASGGVALHPENMIATRRWYLFDENGVLVEEPPKRHRKDAPPEVLGEGFRLTEDDCGLYLSRHGTNVARCAEEQWLLWGNNVNALREVLGCIDRIEAWVEESEFS